MRTGLNCYLSGMDKYWANMGALYTYQRGDPYTVVTADISPTAKCNLDCGECLVQGRDRESEIPFEVLRQYLSSMAGHGCKGVLFTGGGEPTMYHYLRAAVDWARQLGMKVGLITNGYCLDHVIGALSWLRVSYHGQPAPKVPGQCGSSDLVVGVSYVARKNTRVPTKELRAFADELGATYIRVVADGRLTPAERENVETVASAWCMADGDPRFLVQRSDKHAPASDTCHRAYFRPYLSEYGGGTVFPCGLVPFMSQDRKFLEEFAICKAKDVGKFLSGEIVPAVNPKEKCGSCQCARVIETLERVKHPQQMHAEWV